MIDEGTYVQDLVSVGDSTVVAQIVNDLEWSIKTKNNIRKKTVNSERRKHNKKKRERERARGEREWKAYLNRLVRIPL